MFYVSESSAEITSASILPSNVPGVSLWGVLTLYLLGLLTHHPADQCRNWPPVAGNLYCTWPDWALEAAY